MTPNVLTITHILPVTEQNMLKNEVISVLINNTLRYTVVKVLNIYYSDVYIVNINISSL